MKQHRGIIFQITCDFKRRRRRVGQEIIAAGGRYDKMLQVFERISERSGLTSKENRHHGVGISISLDRLVSVIQELLLEDSNIEMNVKKFGINIAVGLINKKNKREHELADLLRQLWSLDLRVTKLDFNKTEEMLDYCRKNLIPCVIILDDEKENLSVHFWERKMKRFKEQKMSTTEFTEYLRKPNTTSQQTDTPPVLYRSESKINNMEPTTNPHNTSINVNINFVLSEKDKLSSSGRKSYRNSMLAQLSSSLHRISYKDPIEVFAVFLEMPVIKTIFGLLELDEKEQDFQRSVQFVIEE